MNNLIKKIKNNEDITEVIKLIIKDFFVNGPIKGCYLEILSYIKLYQPNALEPYEEDILCMMGLAFKKELNGTNNIKTLMQKGFMEAIYNKYRETFTPVQANIINNVTSNKYFSFSSATSTGKSFVFRKLIIEESKDIAIIVPSRALINEYYLRVTDAIQDKKVNILTFPDIINTDISTKNIFILTPERAKELFKIKDRIDIKLALFDEAQITDDPSKRGIIFDSIVRRIKTSFPNAKMLFAHPYIENPEAQLEKNALVDGEYEAINYNYKNVGQIYTCVDKDFNYYHFGIDKELLGNQKVEMNYDPITKCISQKGTVLVYTSKSSIYSGEVLQDMDKYIEMCPEIKEERALKYILQIKELIGGSSDKKSNTYSKLLNLLKKGIVIHHGSLPLSVRIIIEKFTQDGYCRLCFATSTLYQGINMPFDIVYIKRFEKSKNLLIKNLIGRAGRSSIDKKFDYGQIIVSTDNMSDLRNCLKEKNIISNESQLDIISEEDDEEMLEFKESINKNEFSDEYNMTNNQIERLNENEIDSSIKYILDTLLENNRFISSEAYNSLSSEVKRKVMKSFEHIYEKHLKNRELVESERQILDNAIKIFIWQINGKKFKEIIGYRFSYITKQNERKKLHKIIQTATNKEIKQKLIEVYDNLEPHYTIAASQLPNPKLQTFNMFAKQKINEVSYDLVMYDTYDYIDKVWGFCLIDIYYAAFKLYYERTNDERGKIMTNYIRFGTVEEKEIWLIRYGYEFEDIEWIKPCIDDIDEKRIVFNENIKKLDEEQINKINRYI